MPQIIVRGIKPEDMCKISQDIIDNLVEKVKCPRDYFEIECISSVKVTNGVVEQPYPFVEVAWFDRGQKVQDDVARIITDSIREVLGVSDMDLAFTLFEKNRYYENGEHF